MYSDRCPPHGKCVSAWIPRRGAQVGKDATAFNVVRDLQSCQLFVLLSLVYISRHVQTYPTWEGDLL